MASEAQVNANRQNATKSTGPRTADGKRRSRLNAAKHGLFASEVLLTFGDGQEDPETLEALYEGIREQLKPEGELEKELVSELVGNLWRRRRLHRYERACVEYNTATAVHRRDREEMTADPFALSPEEMAAESVRLRGLLEEIAAGSPPEPSTRLMDEIVERAGHIQAVEIDAIFGMPMGSWAARRVPPPTTEVFRRIVAALCAAFGDTEDQLWSHYTSVWEAELAPLTAYVEKRSLAEDLARRLGEVPEETELHKIIRYEAHLSRQFARLLDQLLRLQSIRIDQPLAQGE
jgi:hypothetical protein